MQMESLMRLRRSGLSAAVVPSTCTSIRSDLLLGSPHDDWTGAVAATAAATWRHWCLICSLILHDLIRSKHSLIPNSSGRRRRPSDRLIQAGLRPDQYITRLFPHKPQNVRQAPDMHCCCFCCCCWSIPYNGVVPCSAFTLRSWCVLCYNLRSQHTVCPLSHMYYCFSIKLDLTQSTNLIIAIVVWGAPL